MELDELEQFMDVDAATVAGGLTWGQAKGAGAGVLIGFFAGYYLGLGAASILLILALAVLGGALRTPKAGVPLWRRLWHYGLFVQRTYLRRTQADAQPIERPTHARYVEVVQDDRLTWSIWHPGEEDDHEDDRRQHSP